MHRVGERVTPYEYEQGFHAPLPPLSAVPSIRAGYQHAPVYSLRSEGAEQKWAALNAKQSGVVACCGQYRGDSVLTHQDIKALSDAGTFRRVPYVPPPSPWLYLLLGVVVALPVPFVVRAVQRRTVQRRLAERVQRRYEAQARASRVSAALDAPPSGGPGLSVSD